MSDGKICPGLVSGESAPTFTTSRGEERLGIEEAPNSSSYLGISQPRRVFETSEERTRSRFTTSVLALLGMQVVLGVVSLTVLTIMGRPTDVVLGYLDGLKTPFFGLAMLVAGYYFGQIASKRKRS